MPQPINPRDIQGKAPQEVASIFLTAHDGIQRQAEVAAWEQHHRFPEQSQEAHFWLSVINHIVFGGEWPPVDRQQFVATPAMVGGVMSDPDIDALLAIRDDDN